MKIILWSLLFVCLLYHQTGEVSCKRSRGGGSRRRTSAAQRPAVRRPAPASCPNPGFVSNHVCTRCNNPQDALTWVQNNRNRVPQNWGNGRWNPMVTTVFGGNINYRNGPRQRNQIGRLEDSCEMTRAVRTWDCYVDPQTGQWSICNNRNLCRGLSSKGRPGHLWGATIRGPACLNARNPFSG